MNLNDIYSKHIHFLIHFQAVAETSILILYNESLSHYSESMRDSFNKNHTYFKESELLDIHTKAKNESFEMVRDFENFWTILSISVKFNFFFTKYLSSS